ncbi:hydroxyectoine utilization dehydratase EutB [Rhizobium sp. TH2]|uniref:hydroxyectoine utilization dehydratase EutB n=1 Tax=Rhizobium sp. TH2 TaxID=2775403 RepID=UPI002157B827|nr:hydroxyectoine utilization dehydratase EutB [Rhizobium sp. TH2]UVC09892.1 hydroxyectoine utilization dehydratase EutB [Rhizobium sp. TH2]
MSAERHVSLDDIRAAAARVSGHVLRTPMAQSASLSALCGVPVHLKLESHQRTGAFKLRGATNAMLTLSADQRKHGVVAASTGNHGRALAYAARSVGSKATICMSSLVPQNKVDEVRRLGAEVRISGRSQDEAQIEVDRLVAEEGLIMVPPFDNAAVIAGQGTIGLELVEDLPDLEMVLVQVSGGGLASGIAAAVKALKPGVKIIGLTMDRGAAMKLSIAAGRPVEVEEYPSLADSLGGGIGLDNKLTFSMCQTLLDDIILVTEAEIAAGIRHAYEQEREVLEGAGAIGIAALVAGNARLSGPTAVILSGRNIDMRLHRHIINGGELEDAP